MTLRSAAVLLMALVTIFRLAGYLTEPSLSDAVIHQVAAGSNEPEPSGEPTRRRLRIVSWNIERGVRFDGILEELRSIDADVLLLQEVDRYCQRSGARDVARDLARSLGMNWITGGEFQEVGEGNGTVAATTGQAILSRDEIRDARVIVFRDQAHLRWRLNLLQPRRGGRIALKATTAGIVFYNLHLESGGSDDLRRSQLAQVLADAALDRRPPVVIAGDFNSSAGATPSMVGSFDAAAFTDVLKGAKDRRTSVRHAHPIDWMFARNIRSREGHMRPAANLSDHYPLVGAIQLEP